MAMDSSQRHERAWTGTDPPDRYGQGVHELIAWCGFLGAWLLFAGPIYQAALEPGGSLLNYAIGALPLSVAG